MEVEEEMPKSAMGKVPPSPGPEDGSSEDGEELTFRELLPGRRATRVFP